MSHIVHSAKLHLGEYAGRVRLFQFNARLYLINVILTGAAMGVFRLIFNFYVLSLGFDEALLGSLVTTTSLTSLLVALPMGYLADLLGRKMSLILAGAMSSLAIFIMIVIPTPSIFYLTNVLFGIGQALAAVTMAPFLMENSGEEERTYLFSFGSGLQMAAASLGSWIGGYMPGWIGGWRSVAATSSVAYGGTLLVISIFSTAALLPLFLLRTDRGKRSERTVFTPLSYAAEHPRTLTRLILPMLLTSIGAGLIMPFMNVFFRQVHQQPDPVIGTLFAWGSLAMGLGLLAAPPLAERMGKIQCVVVTQGLSIPFLILLGFAPWFWVSAAAYYIRVALMNMSSPVYNTYVMEHVDPDSRATVASLVSMSWNFGWAFSPMISGWMQVAYGWNMPFLGTILLYSASIFLYWSFFLRGQKGRLQDKPELIPGD